MYLFQCYKTVVSQREVFEGHGVHMDQIINRLKSKSPAWWTLLGAGLLMLSIGCRELAVTMPQEVSYSAVKTSFVAKAGEASEAPKSETSSEPIHPSLTVPVGIWVGRSPDGTATIEFDFQTGGKVTWRFISDTGEMSALQARYEWDGHAKTGTLRIFDFDRPILQGGQFSGLIQFESLNVIRIEGELQTVEQSSQQPASRGAHSVRLIRQNKQVRATR